MEEKIIDITDRVPTMRKQRRKRTNIKFIVLTTIFFIIIVLLLYFQTSISDIKKISVTGDGIVDSSYYEVQSGLTKNDSMWGFQVKDIEKSLLENDWVKSVKVERKLLNEVKITVEEWQKVAYISKDNSFYPILENGVVYGESGELVPIDAPIFLAFDDESLRQKILKELAKLEPEVLALISQINASPSEADPYAVTLFMNDGYEVRAEITSLSSKLNYYPSIIAQIEQADSYEKGIIDIEVGSYYRPFKDEYASELDEPTDLTETAGQEVIDLEQEVAEDEEPSAE